MRQDLPSVELMEARPRFHTGLPASPPPPHLTSVTPAPSTIPKGVARGPEQRGNSLQGVQAWLRPRF